MKTRCPHFFRNAAAFLVLLLVLTANLYTQPQYYNYNTAGTTNSFPFNIPGGKQVQLLYLPGDFTSPTPAPSGNITKIYFKMNAAIGSWTYSNFVIKMGQETGFTTFATGSWYTGTMTTVFDSSSIVLSAPLNGWLEITLETPFLYDNTKSLIVDVQQCGAPAASGFSTAYTTMPNMRRNAGPLTSGTCPFVWGNQGGQTHHIGIDVSPATVNCSYSWGTNTSGVTALLQAVSAPSSTVCWVAGATATVRRTTDGGTTWTDANPNPGVITGDVYNIWALDANTALLTTSPGATFIYRTTNGGANWTQVFTQAGGFIDAIVMSSATTGYAYGDPVGARWSLWKTTDGGVTWDSTGMYLPQAASEAGWNNAMCVVGNNIWFGTNNTKVYRSTNGGATGSWTGVVTTGNVSTYGVWFTSATNGLCVGTIVQKTTDGGATWVNAGAPAGTGNMTSVGGIGDTYWLSRGNNIYGSSDFGATWTAGGYTGATALWGTSITTGSPCLAGWSVGATGTVVKLNGVPVAVNDPTTIIPSAYKLEQNYPNPFNPTTNITFALPKSGVVVLNVYDVLGKEVASLVNSFTNAGTHIVPFDASALSSGVYIYKITTGDFTDSKKMVLIK